jgi:hypothetical protein
MVHGKTRREMFYAKSARFTSQRAEQNSRGRRQKSLVIKQDASSIPFGIVATGG